MPLYVVVYAAADIADVAFSALFAAAYAAVDASCHCRAAAHLPRATLLHAAMPPLPLFAILLIAAAAFIFRYC